MLAGLCLCIENSIQIMKKILSLDFKANSAKLEIMRDYTGFIGYNELFI